MTRPKKDMNESGGEEVEDDVCCDAAEADRCWFDMVQEVQIGNVECLALKVAGSQADVSKL